MTQQIQSDIINNQLPDGWVETTLEKVVKLIIDHRGLTPKKLGGDWDSFGYRAISAKSIKNGCLVNEEQMNILPENLYKKRMKEEVDYGDIFLTSEAPLGEHMIWQSDEKLVLSQRIFGIRTKKDLLDPFYFNYFIDSPYYQHELKSKESGSTVTGIKQSELIKTRIILPSLPEQVAIASLLSSFDDKIELLREENKTLEQTAQTIFQEWFGKYGVDDELPEGWRVGKIMEIIKREPVSYKCDKKDLDPKGKTPIIDQGTNGLYGYTSRDPDFQASKEHPVIVFTNHTCNYWFIDYPFCAIQNVLPYRGKNGYDEYFLYFMTKGSITFIEYKGHWPDFEAKDFIIPTTEKAQEFSNIAKPVLEKISDNRNQIKSLSQTRDELLPRLMKGDVRMDF